ncbi:Sporulation-specific N-acetylmuramoyl-L-alanine amidase [uncultured Clostridium sp.]|nr:Sporulation-specific N-acetylmuramoyl-L-alanine amidase [uncultured Clostridium sp.]SCJ00025.1 Sporulation-specific N-acetylmuramoyl-L-alanine amidase [uncultured Clostridium sp.]
MKFYLDFGHGGKDSGALGKNNTKESDIVLKIGLIIKEILEKSNEKVITTRENNTYYTLSQRFNKANKENCDYFISIHMNSSTNTSAKGTETWVYNLNSKISTLGKNLTSNISKNLNTPNRGVKESKKFSVLKNTKMPAIIIEIDFISNPEIEDLCKKENYLQKLAKTIASTLLNFINKETIPETPLYKVTIGAFKDKNNALKLKNEALSKGFKNTYITT